MQKRKCRHLSQKKGGRCYPGEMLQGKKKEEERRSQAPRGGEGIGGGTSKESSQVSNRRCSPTLMKEVLTEAEKTTGDRGKKGRRSPRYHVLQRPRALQTERGGGTKKLNTKGSQKQFDGNTYLSGGYQIGIRQAMHNVKGEKRSVDPKRRKRPSSCPRGNYSS